MQLLTDQEAGEFLGVSRQTVWRWLKEIDGFPRPIQLGPQTTRWRKSDLERYINAKAE